MGESVFRWFTAVGLAGAIVAVVAIVACATHNATPNRSTSIYAEQSKAVLSFYDYLNHHPTPGLKKRVGSMLSDDLKRSFRTTWTTRYGFMRNVRVTIDDAANNLVHYTVTYDYVADNGMKLGWRRIGEWKLIHSRGKWLLNRDDWKSNIITTLTIRGDPPLYVDDRIDSSQRHTFYALGYREQFTQTANSWRLATIGKVKQASGQVAVPVQSDRFRHNVLWALSAFFLFITLLLGFAQFLIGDDDRAIRDRLADWYVDIEDGDWAKLVAFATATTERFLTYVFGAKIISLRYFLIAVPLSAAVGLLVIVFPLVNSYEQLSPYQQEMANTAMFQQLWAANRWLVASWLTGNVLIDVTALAATRWYFRRISLRSRLNVGRDVFVLVAVAYLCVGLSLNILALTVILILRANGTPLAFLPWPVYLLGPLWLPIRVAALDPRGLLLNAMVVAPAGFFAFVLLGVYVGSVLAFISRPFTREPLAALVERLAAAKNGVLPTIAAGFTAMAAGVALFK